MKKKHIFLLLKHFVKLLIEIELAQNIEAFRRIIN